MAAETYSPMVLVAGTAGSVETIARKRIGANRETDIVITGPYSFVENLQPSYGSTASPCPPGFTVEDSTIVPDGKGGGVLTIHCVNYGTPAAQGFAPAKVVYEIDMVEVSKDLEQHPTLAQDTTIKTIKAWLASDPLVQYGGKNTTYAYTNADGDKVDIPDNSNAAKFCAAYTHGIRTYLEFYPVIKKISTWEALPGVSMSGNTQSGGSISQFSADIGKWDAPPMSLSGYASGNWFKNGDRYVGNQDKTYTRTEQWTYTPDGSGSAYGWIYSSSGGGS